MVDKHNFLMNPEVFLEAPTVNFRAVLSPFGAIFGRNGDFLRFRSVKKLFVQMQ